MLTSLILMAAVLESPPAVHHQPTATVVVQIPVDQVVAAIANTDIEWGGGLLWPHAYSCPWRQSTDRVALAARNVAVFGDGPR